MREIDKFARRHGSEVEELRRWLVEAMVLGAAEGVAAMVLEKMKARVLAYGGASASDLPYMRANVARAFTTLNAAGALLESECRRIGDASREGRPFTVEERAAVRANCTWVVKQSRAVINDLCDQSGTSSFFVQSDLQRFHREVNVMSSHASSSDRAAPGQQSVVMLLLVALRRR